MRIRTIKPAFWSNEKMAALPDFVRLLAIGLLNYADDHGFFWANSKMVRGSLFPFEEDHNKITKGLAHLASEGYVILGKVKDGRECGRVVNFKLHQRVDKPQDSEIEPVAIFQDQSENDLGSIADQSALYRKGREGKGSILPPESEAVKDERHHAITERWGELYESAFGVKYAFNGGKDGSALKRLLKTTAEPADTILDTAQRAWRLAKEFQYAKKAKEAATLHGFCTFFNEIRAELVISARDHSGAPSLDLIDVGRFNVTRT